MSGHPSAYLPADGISGDDAVWIWKGSFPVSSPRTWSGVTKKAKCAPAFKLCHDYVSISFDTTGNSDLSPEAFTVMTWHDATHSLHAPTVRRMMLRHVRSRPLSCPGLVRGRPSIAPQSRGRSEEHPSELQSLMRISYAVFCLKK